jgi:DNA mismatch repair ATPase MutS
MIIKEAEINRNDNYLIDIIGNDKNNKVDRHFCIFDELYSGTNPTEATKSAYAFLLYLSKRENVDFILTTHYVSICKKLKRSSKIQNYKMLIDLSGGTNNVKYTYKMKKGISKIQGAILILEEMNYPREIIDEIRYYGG